MKKFDVLCVDPPWAFSDKLTMSDVDRGSESQYDVLDLKAIKELPIEKIAVDDSLLALWVPSSLLQEGLDVMKTWGFKQTQTHIWIKIKKTPFAVNLPKYEDLSEAIKYLLREIDELDFDKILAFGMGRLFRQTHEICLIGVRGKVYNKLKNKSQRSVHFDINKKHSAKPEKLQNMLELMFPDSSKIELFARRQRKNWWCLGLEAPMTDKEDIRTSLAKFETISDSNIWLFEDFINSFDGTQNNLLFDLWNYK